MYPKMWNLELIARPLFEMLVLVITSIALFVALEANMNSSFNPFCFQQQHTGWSRPLED